MDTGTPPAEDTAPAPEVDTGAPIEEPSGAAPGRLVGLRNLGCGQAAFAPLMVFAYGRKRRRHRG